jgi:hypothetical protein
VVGGKYVGSRSPRRATGEAEAVGRPASVRGHGPEQAERRESNMISEAKPAPKSPDQEQSGSKSGDRRLFAATAPNKPRDAKATRSARRSRPRSRPTKNRAEPSRATGACSRPRPRTSRETRKQQDQQGEAGPEVARPSTQPDHQQSDTQAGNHVPPSGEGGSPRPDRVRQETGKWMAPPSQTSIPAAAGGFRGVVPP